MQISVIIPTYCPKDYIWRCLHSLECQTLPRDKWELLIILNGPKDPYFSDIQLYLQNHLLNASLFYCKPQGVSNARNLGLDKAMGEYITFMDDDDYVSPTYLQELLSKVTPDTIAISNTIAFNEQNDNIPYSIGNEFKRCSCYGKQKYSYPKKYFSGPCMKLFPKNIFGSDRFNTTFRNGEDSLMMFQISNKMSMVDFTSEHAIYFRYLRPNSASFATPFLYRTYNSLNLMKKYTTLFLTRKGYSFSFYLSRIFGAIHTILVG